MSNNKNDSVESSSDRVYARLFKLWAMITKMIMDGKRDPNVVADALQKIVDEPVCKWREQDGVIYFTLPATDGTTGPEWIKRLEKKGFRLSKWAKDVLNSKDFKPTTGIVNEIAVLKGMLFEDNDRITKKIRAEADKRKLTTPNTEIACMIREMFTDEEIKAMGLIWIVAMHEPIKDSAGDPALLNVYRDVDGQWVDTTYDNPVRRWNRGDGFAFVVQQVSTQA